jgi:hypothetical protein
MNKVHKQTWGAVAIALIGAGALAVAGCYHTPLDPAEGPAPLRMPPPDKQGDACCYEDGLTGGHIFSMYCGSCHNARTLSERPFSSYKNVAAHMHTRANLTGSEHAVLVAWMRRWADVPPPNPPVEPSPKRLTFSQPVNELHAEKPAPDEGARPAGPNQGPEAGPVNPPRSSRLRGQPGL